MGGSRTRLTGRLPVPLPLLDAAALALPGSLHGLATYVGVPTVELAPPLLVLLYGLAIVGAAFALAWAAEAAQVDINAGIALALLALVAVLPEYAVDFVFTAQCGSAYAAEGGSPDVCGLALANMTGANRILVGVGWPLVVLVSALAVRRAARGGTPAPVRPATPGRTRVRIAPVMSVEVGFLLVATLYSLTLPLRSSLTLLDSAVLLAIFAAYSWRLAQMPATGPELSGVSHWVGSQPRGPRRAWVGGLFVGAALVILFSAEHFAESLVATGSDLGVDEFLLVQWIAPLASESPELMVACLLAWRLKGGDALGALLSSKVNQWTLLVGGLSIVFALTHVGIDGLPVDGEQRYELLITAAQSLLAIALLVTLRLTVRSVLLLLTLFMVQLLASVPGSDRVHEVTILAMSGVYLALAVVLLALRWRAVVKVGQTALVRDLDTVATEPVETTSSAERR